MVVPLFLHYFPQFSHIRCPGGGEGGVIISYTRIVYSYYFSFHVIDLFLFNREYLDKVLRN